MKKYRWKLEYSVTIYILLGIILLLVPLHIENYWQARMITRWNDKYEKISYMFSVINAQKDEENGAEHNCFYRYFRRYDCVHDL